MFIWFNSAHKFAEYLLMLSLSMVMDASFISEVCVLILKVAIFLRSSCIDKRHSNTVI